MDWIKVTPETMPPDMVIVMATIVDFGEKSVMQEVAYNHKEKMWFWYDDVETGDFYPLEDEVVTHWMPYPDPAED